MQYCTIQYCTIQTSSYRAYLVELGVGVVAVDQIKEVVVVVVGVGAVATITSKGTTQQIQVNMPHTPSPVPIHESRRARSELPSLIAMQPSTIAGMAHRHEMHRHAITPNTTCTKYTAYITSI